MHDTSQRPPEAPRPRGRHPGRHTGAAARRKDEAPRRRAARTPGLCPAGPNASDASGAVVGPLPLGEQLKTAAARLVPLIRARVLAAGLSRGADPGDLARDVFQQAALEALRCQDRLEPGSDPVFWLFGIAMNLLRRRAEEQGRAARVLPWPDDGDDDAGEVAALQHLRERLSVAARSEELTEAQQQVARLLRRIPEAHAEVLRLFYLEHDEDYDAVAAALGLRPATVRVRCFRALRAARALLGEEQR